MKGRVLLSLSIDAADEADAIGSVLALLAHRLRRCPTDAEARDWLATNLDVRFEASQPYRAPAAGPEDEPPA